MKREVPILYITANSRAGVTKYGCLPVSSKVSDFPPLVAHRSPVYPEKLELVDLGRDCSHPVSTGCPVLSIRMALCSTPA